MKHCTTINFTLHKSAMATIIIYNTLGGTIATPLSKELPSGNHSVAFDASNLPSGMYF